MGLESREGNDGMDTVSELKEYVRFQFNLLQEKDTLNRKMAADIKSLRQKVADYLQTHESS